MEHVTDAPSAIAEGWEGRLRAEPRLWLQTTWSPDCWVWQGPRLPKGYGRLNCGGRYVLAHRLSYEIHYGPIPKGLLVCHSCDNPPCIRPDHLFLGTAKENSADMWAKGRQRQGAIYRGSRSTNAKLTESQVATIRARYATGGVTQYEIAAEYGVSQATVKELLNFETWRHVR